MNIKIHKKSERTYAVHGDIQHLEERSIPKHIGDLMLSGKKWRYYHNNPNLSLGESELAHLLCFISELNSREPEAMLEKAVAKMGEDK